MTNEPPAKRLKTDTNNIDNDDDDDLLKILEGSATTDEKEEEEEAARQRRMERRKRWKTADNNNNNNVIAPIQQKVETTTKEKLPPLQEQDAVVNKTVEKEQLDDDDDDFDMFSSSISPLVTTTATTNPTTLKKDDFDDAEGYYKPVIGETIDCGSHNKYKVVGIVGKGVFSTVLKGKSTEQEQQQQQQQQQVALKLIRNNDTMRKAAMTEIRVLRKLSPHAHVVTLLHPSSTQESDVSTHHSHVIMVFPFVQYNLRDVLQKFGRGVGISIQSVQLYFAQLLSALRHLQKHSILHCDLKPDNILVSSDFSTLQVCDFGSACLLEKDETNSIMMIPTPYLVSRYYRAPEIILGAIPSYGIDLWSAAVTVAELFLGKVLFSGNTNSDMLLSMFSILGSPSPKLVKQHLLQCNTHYGLPKYLQGHYFLQQDTDKVTGVLVKKQISLLTFPTKPSLQSLLLKAKSRSDSRVLVLKFALLLKQCLALDPSRRINLKSAMHNDFFTTTTTTTTTKSDQKKKNNSGS